MARRPGAKPGPRRGPIAALKGAQNFAPEAAITITPATGSLVLTGATPVQDMTIVPIIGTVVMTGIAPVQGAAVVPATGALTITGPPPVVIPGMIITPASGTLETITKYFSLPGVAGNFAASPDSVVTSITGDVDLRAKITTPSLLADEFVIGKWDGSTGNASYGLAFTITNGLRLYQSVDGTAITTAADSTVAIATGLLSSGVFIRATLKVNNGAGGRDVNFYTSSDGVNWTQLGATVTLAGTTTIFDSTARVIVGALNEGINLFAYTGNIFYAEVRNGINGTVVAKFDPKDSTIADDNQWTSSTGEVWSVYKSGAPSAQLVWTNSTPTITVAPLNPVITPVSGAISTDIHFRNQPSLSGDNVTTPNSTAVQITGDIDLRANIGTDWFFTATQVFIAKRSGGAAANAAYGLYVNGLSGLLGYFWSDGTNIPLTSSSVAVPAATNASLWVRATHKVDNGRHGNDVTFYTSSDSVNWVQLGIVTTRPGTTSINNTTDYVELGSQLASTSTFMNGNIFRAEIRSGINGVLKAVFDAKDGPLNSLSVTSAATGEVWTLNHRFLSSTGSIAPVVIQGTVITPASGVLAMSSPPESIFTSTTPANPNAADSPDYDLGVKFQSAKDGFITALMFYKAASDVGGTHIGRLYTSGGVQLGSVTFVGETASGWQTQVLASPIAITANTTYIVSVNVNSSVGASFYPFTSHGLDSSVVNGNLSTIVGSNGVFNTPQTGLVPTTSFNNSNYFRDVVFTTGSSPIVTQSIVRAPTAGALTLTGVAPTVTQSGSGNTTITPVVGSLVLTGIAPSVTRQNTLTPVAGALVLTGAAPAVTRQDAIQPVAGALTLTGAAPTVSLGIYRIPNSVALVLTGVASSLDTRITPSAGALVLTGISPVVAGVGQVTPQAGALTLTGAAPTIVRQDTITPAAGALVLSGVAPAVTAQVTIRPNAGALALGPQTLVVTQQQTLVPAAGSLVLSGSAPTVLASINITPGTGTLVLTGKPAVVGQTGVGSTVTPGTGTVVFVGYAPTIFVTPGQSLRGTLLLSSRTATFTLAPRGTTLILPARPNRFVL